MWHRHRGIVVDDGPTDQVVSAYQESFGSAGIGAHVGRAADGPVQLDSVRLVAPDGSALQQLRRGDPFEIEVCFTNRDSVMGLDAAIYVEDSRGLRIVDEAVSDLLHLETDLTAAGEYRLMLDVPAPLAVKEYVVGVWLGASCDVFLDEPVLRFEIQPALEDRREHVTRSRVLHGTGRLRLTMSP